MKKREDNPTVTLNVKFNDLYDLWDHLATLVMRLDEVQEELTELTAVAYDICRRHEKDSATTETAEFDNLVNELNQERKKSDTEKDDEDEAEVLAIALLKAVFQALTEAFDENE